MRITGYLCRALYNFYSLRLHGAPYFYSHIYISEEQKAKQIDHPYMKHTYDWSKEKCTNSRLFSRKIMGMCTVTEAFLIWGFMSNIYFFSHLPLSDNNRKQLTSNSPWSSSLRLLCFFFKIKGRNSLLCNRCHTCGLLLQRWKQFL